MGLREGDARTRTAVTARRALGVRVRSRIATALPVAVRKHQRYLVYKPTQSVVYVRSCRRELTQQDIIIFYKILLLSFIKYSK